MEFIGPRSTKICRSRECSRAVRLRVRWNHPSRQSKVERTRMNDDACPNAVTFSFGDSPEMADELLALVLSGKKTATCGALAQFAPGGEAMPAVGRRDVVLDGHGRRVAVI